MFKIQILSHLYHYDLILRLGDPSIGLSVVFNYKHFHTPFIFPNPTSLYNLHVPSFLRDNFQASISDSCTPAHQVILFLPADPEGSLY